MAAERHGGAGLMNWVHTPFVQTTPPIHSHAASEHDSFGVVQGVPARGHGGRGVVHVHWAGIGGGGAPPQYAGTTHAHVPSG